MIPSLIPRLWAWACTRGTCPYPVAACPAGGIHWVDKFDEQAGNGPRAAYDLVEGGPEPDGYHIYMYAELDPDGLREEREAVGVGAGHDWDADWGMLGNGMGD